MTNTDDIRKELRRAGEGQRRCHFSNRNETMQQFEARKRRIAAAESARRIGDVQLAIGKIKEGR